jgi:hypothetical protein
MLFVPHWKHAYLPPWSVTGIAFFFADDVHASQETHLWISTVCYGIDVPLYAKCTLYDEAPSAHIPLSIIIE